MSSPFVTSCVRALLSPSLLVLALLAWVTAFLKGLSCCCFLYVFRLCLVCFFLLSFVFSYPCVLGSLFVTCLAWWFFRCPYCYIVGARFALPRADMSSGSPCLGPKGAMLPSFPPSDLLVGSGHRSSLGGGGMLRMLRPRPSVQSCVHAWGLFFWRTCMHALFVCLFSVGQSVGRGVCLSCLTLLIIVFLCFMVGFCHFCSLLYLVVLTYVMLHHMCCFRVYMILFRLSCVLFCVFFPLLFCCCFCVLVFPPLLSLSLLSLSPSFASFSLSVSLSLRLSLS